MTDDDAVRRLIDGAVSHFGRIDVMINNAGLGGTKSILEMTDAEWLRVLDITLNGTFRCTRAALRQLVAQGHGGAVVNNASVLGWRAQDGQAHYAAAKAGVMALTRCAAMDVAGHGIRVNAVAPSLATHPFLAKVMSPELLAELAGREAFGRGAEPWEVAAVMAFLASDYAVLPHRRGDLGEQPARLRPGPVRAAARSVTDRASAAPPRATRRPRPAPRASRACPAGCAPPRAAQCPGSAARPRPRWHQPAGNIPAATSCR